MTEGRAGLPGQALRLKRINVNEALGIEKRRWCLLGKWTPYLYCGLVADTLLPPHGMLGIRVHSIHFLQFCPDCLMCEITNILEIIACLSLILPFFNWEQCHVIKTSEIPANQPCGPTSHCPQQSKVKFLLRNYMNSMNTVDSKFLFQVKTLYSSHWFF